jgi:putative membrane protein
VGARFLDDEAHAAFKETIEEIESASAVEVVVAMRRRSAGYLHANLIVGAVVAFVSLAAMLFAAYSFSLVSILVDPFVVGAIAGGLVELLPVVKRVLTPERVRRRHVEHAARAAFVDRGVHNTTDRSGLLIYISWLEQQVALVADSNLERSFTVEALRQAEHDLTSVMADGGVAVARKLGTLEAAFAAAMPRRAGDLNELPDAIDSDLSGGRKARR